VQFLCRVTKALAQAEATARQVVLAVFHSRLEIRSLRW